MLAKLGKNKLLYICDPNSTYAYYRVMHDMSIPASTVLASVDVLTWPIRAIVCIVDHLFTKRSNGIVIKRR